MVHPKTIRLRQVVVAGGEEMEEAEVAEDLELLADPPRRASFEAASLQTVISIADETKQP